MITTRKAYAENDKLLATLNEVNERVIKDPSKTYLVWKGSEFPNSTSGSVAFKAPAGCTIDWGDGNVETFEVESTVVNTHTYTDGIEYHLISLLNYNSLGSNAFYDCDDLISVAIGNGITSIGHGAFYACSNLVSVIIGVAVTSIGYSAFYDCDSLTSIIIPYSVTSIGNGAFSSCSSLSNIMIGDSIPLFGKKMSIGDEVLYFCRGLTSVTIGNNVTSIGKGAFKSCRYLKIIKMLLENPPTLTEDLFNDTPIEKIIVPKSAIDTYKSAAIWSTYADKIVYETDSSDHENTFWLSGGKQLEGSINLDNYKTVGNYFRAPDVGSNVTNLPTNAESAFTLKVTALAIADDGTPIFIQQQLRDISGNVYIRTLIPPASESAEATWSKWSFVLTSEPAKTIGSALQPVYLAGGVLTPCTYAIEVRGDLPDTPDANKLYFITDGL